jgi:hypothetical protein
MKPFCKKGCSGGILRACGSQFRLSIATFIGFYIVGSPVANSLLLKTSLEIYGKR